ncbi:hypothetical protein Nepgr_019224 [Nepenthes gracilis]|uniref:GRAM domain-containing protein n=1 Tax=Nepenthes gracilis TaxID=150966 RepID=A0AAD3XU61_NEPGR|nr:hypothetical protein Nepgr_019224 [Nepenthes gracilis]
MNQQPQPDADQSKPSEPEADHRKPSSSHSDYAPYPKLDPNDVVSPADPLFFGHPTDTSPSAPPLATASAGDTTMPPESNPYASPAPVPASSTKNAMESVKGVLGKWGKKAAETTGKAGDLAGNMWQHLKTSPNIADAAVARIAHGTKVLSEGGYEKVFRQTFETVPEEKLQKSYACYLSTSAGPVMGNLYLSTLKLAFCSDNPLSYKVGDQTEWSYYKVVIPLQQIKAVNPSTSKVNPAEKYIQIISVDNHEFWFMGFVNYASAIKNLQGVLQARSE